MFVRFSPCVYWLVFLTSWFLNTVRVVFCFYLMKSARCNGETSLSFSLINILRLLYLLKFYLPLILPEEQMNFKISNIPGNSVYINRYNYWYYYFFMSSNIFYFIISGIKCATCSRAFRHCGVVGGPPLV